MREETFFVLFDKLGGLTSQQLMHGNETWIKRDIVVLASIIENYTVKSEIEQVIDYSIAKGKIEQNDNNEIRLKGYYDKKA